MLSRVSATTERTTAWPALAGGPQFVAIDPNGNLASKVEDGHSWSYEWNAENQLKRVLKDGVEVARFAYDPSGQRVEKVAAGVTTSYVYDGEDILRQTSGVTTVRYVHGQGIDEPLAMENGLGQLVCEHADALGSRLKQTDATGAVTFSRSYDAFGQPQAGSSTGGYAFTGREWDAEIGLHYYRHRYYDPKLGRFISEDPIGFEGGANFFNYVGGNPANWTDPSGLQTVPPPPNVPGGPWTWAPNAQNNRGGTFRGAQGHSASWDPQGHWDVDPPGGGTRLRFCPRGNPLTPAQAHNPPRPGMRPIDFSRRAAGPRGSIRGLGGGGIGRALPVIGWILSVLDYFVWVEECKSDPCGCKFPCVA